MNRRLLPFVAAVLAVVLAAAVHLSAEEPRQPVVTFHLSFETPDFFADEVIAQSGRKTLEERKIDFPEGRFGKGIRMNSIPSTPDQDNMSGIDLDMITSLIFNTRPHTDKGFNEPFFWGSGRCNPRLGAVAFWAKGTPPFPWPLFEQTSNAFGRLERDLIGIRLDDRRRISAYVRDARYVYHELKTETVWDSETWNHVVLNWDWANGLELWLNGRVIATSWGKDAWFETMCSGLFHLPTAGIVYDELYLMDRPLSPAEVRNLMQSNRPPAEDVLNFRRSKDEMSRAARVSGADRSGDFPAVTPDAPVSVKEIWPTKAADGHIPGWFVIDGRNELAWPHEYAFFTIIPGDGDFHAQKVDIQTPSESEVNYVVLSGNLTGVKVQTGSGLMENAADAFSVPEGKGFYYGKSVNAARGATFRIPFVTGWGAPPGFTGDVNLPLTGEKRIQEIGLYHVGPVGNPPAGEILSITSYNGGLGIRNEFALQALTARDERVIALAASRREGPGKPRVTDIGGFHRLNIWTEPMHTITGISSISLSLPVSTLNPEEALFIRVHDPAAPSRLWNQFALTLKGFDSEFKTLRFTLDFQDLVLSGDERLWIDLGSAGTCFVLLDDSKRPGTLEVSKVTPYTAVDGYAKKEIMPALGQFAKMYEFLPWKFTGKTVDLENPCSFGGPFDIIYPALAIKRFKPDHFQADFMEVMSGPFYTDYGNGWPADPSKVPLKTINDPNGAPDWAVYMRDYNSFRHRIADWWRPQQNSNGEVGGGWNDDTLFMSFHMADLPLDCNENARAIIDTVHVKFEDTRLFKDGYCQIEPIDRLHTGDFISERYNTLVNNLGQAYPAEREMESAFRSGHPERTPKNYGNGGAFLSSVNVLNWYWGVDVPKEPYVSKPLAELTKELRLYASAQNDITFYRYTEARVMTDDFMPWGSYETYEYMMGGKRGARWDAHMKLAAMWPFGAGPDIPRLVLKADDTSLDAVCYSFDSDLRNLGMRLCRIRDGRYRVSVLKDPGGLGKGGEVLWKIETPLRRFDVVSLPIPPKTPVLIRVERLSPSERPVALPDLAIDPWDANMKGSAVTAVVHNLGNAPVKNAVVRLLDGDRVVQEKKVDLDAPVDFQPKRTTVTFGNVIPSNALRIVLDPAGAIPEILEENNEAAMRK
jgi:hypothetical protein